MRKLLVGLAVLLLATQAQAELITFSEAFVMDGWVISGPPENAATPWTLTEAPVTGIELTFYEDWDAPDEINVEFWAPWDEGDRLGSGHGIQGPFSPSRVVASSPIQIPSVWVRNDPYGPQVITLKGYLGGIGGSLVWSWTSADEDYVWQECTAGDGLTIDTFTHEGISDGALDDMEVLPEPATLALLGLGGLGLLVSRKKRR